MNEHIKFLHDLAAVGCRYAISVPCVSGVTTEYVTPEQAVRLLSDRDSVYAELAGVTLTDYLHWTELMGSVQCRAQTNAGTRCKHAVVGAVGLSPSHWAKINHDGGYCQVHRG